MYRLKIFSTIGLFAVGAGILWMLFYLPPPPSEKYAEVSPPAPVRETTAAVDSRLIEAEFDKNVQTQADALLPLFERMPPVKVYVKDEPILKSGTNTETANAYTFCDDNQFPLIFVKKIYYRKANKIKFANTLKHELTHVWLCRQHLMSVGHGELFQRKFRSIGGWGSASR